jgi:hypothetical protein
MLLEALQIEVFEQLVRHIPNEYDPLLTQPLWQMSPMVLAILKLVTHDARNRHNNTHHETGTKPPIPPAP